MITKREIYAIVLGNVLATLNDHGPIDRDLAASAAKRITGKLHSDLVTLGVAKPCRRGRAAPGRVTSRRVTSQMDLDDLARETLNT